MARDLDEWEGFSQEAKNQKCKAYDDDDICEYELN